MSSQTIGTSTANQLTVHTDTSKTFLWNNRFQTESYTNGGGSPITLLEGTLMGRISATGKVIPLASAASDGSQFVLGVLNQDVTVAAGATVNVAICVSGDVAAEKIVLAGSDTLDTAMSGRRIRDKIQGESMGIKLVACTENTGFDN
jgi:hypothetical protein